MNKVYALMIGLLLVFPVVFASHYGSYGNYDYSSTKDYEYVRYSETEDSYRN